MNTRLLTPWLFFGLCTLTACGGSDPKTPQTPLQPVQPAAQFVFQQPTLAGLTVDRLYQQQGKVLALTSDGLYQQQSAGEWLLLGFKGMQPRDLAFITEQHWLAALTIQRDSGEQEHQLHESFDAGRNWVQVKRSFGAQGDSEAIYALHYDVASRQLLATGVSVLASSTDFGISWQLLQGNWSGFGQPKSALAVDPQSGNIWWGGQGALEDGMLNQYRPADQSGKQFRGLLPDPSVYYNIRFRRENGSSSIYACGEGGIVHSSDQGQNWRNLMGDVNYRFYFDVAFDPQRPNRLYTAGWDKKFEEPQPLILQWSDDNGSSWQRLQHQAPANFFGGVRSLLLVNDNNQQYLYLGLFKGGIMRVQINQ